MAGTLDFVSNITVDSAGDSLILSGKANAAAKVEVSFNGQKVLATLDSDGYWKASADIGLGTTVEYQVLVDDVAVRTETTRTLPSGNTLRILLGSCFDSFISGFFDNAAARNPDLILDGGDHGYFWLSSSANGATAPGDPAAIRTIKEPMLRAAKVQSLFSKFPAVCMYSDCDGAGSNSDSSYLGFTSGAVQSAHRQIFAHAPLPMADNHGRVIVWKRWRIIITDELTTASPKGAADIPGKSKLGAAQLAWFKSQIDIAADQNQGIVWFGDGPFHPPTTSSGTSNEWSRYNAERLEIVAYLESKGVENRIIRANGDRHSLAADNGINNPFGGFPTVNAAPFHTTANPYGMAASQGTYPPSQINSSRQYAIMELFDDGETLTVTTTGYSSTAAAPTEVQRFALTMDFTPLTEEQLMTIQAELDSAFEEVGGQLKQRVVGKGGVQAIETITLSAYNALKAAGTVVPGTVYITVG